MHADTLWTIGHSTRPWDEFVGLLQEAAIECVVDVRRFAGSRRNPQYSPLAMAPEAQELAAKLRELREHVEKNAENVGRQFPHEARKIHYGDSEHRAIYGQATAEETRSLIDEGVEVMPLPLLPDERN